MKCTEGVSAQVSRRLTFKDVAHLSNAPDVSLMDYFGVHKNTVSVYHQMGKFTPLKAASKLSRGSVGAPKASIDSFEIEKFFCVNFQP